MAIRSPAATDFTPYRIVCRARLACAIEEVGIETTPRGEEESDRTPFGSSFKAVEIAEAILLALVTIAAAWSGYQAARWDGRNALFYGQASKYRTIATQRSTAAGQSLILDVVTFNRWITAETSGRTRLAALFARRFSPRYRKAFDAWLKTNPQTNSSAPAGPSFMPGYRRQLAGPASRFNTLAGSVFQTGTDARETGDKYVRTTVFLAAILFLIVIAQRLRVRGVRHALTGVAFLLLVYGAYTLFTYPVA